MQSFMLVPSIYVANDACYNSIVQQNLYFWLSQVGGVLIYVAFTSCYDLCTREKLAEISQRLKTFILEKLWRNEISYQEDFINISAFRWLIMFFTDFYTVLQSVVSLKTYKLPSYYQKHRHWELSSHILSPIHTIDLGIPQMFPSIASQHTCSCLAFSYNFHIYGRFYWNECKLMWCS